MSANLDKLRRLLAELFQLDQADLDFGIYRIMNAKREEITRFLETDLLPQVKEAFQAYRGQDRAALEGQLQEAIQKAKELEVDPETTKKVRELREKLAAAVDVTALENEVFSDLYNFFRRYYNEGDFLSLRRYKEGVYAIPYEGEEVKLHWANADQYYIKTAEYFRNYTFKLPSGKRVHFKLAEADTERDNNQAQAGNDRRFILSETDPLLEQDGDLIIRFEYHPDAAGRKQKDLNEKAVERILHVPGFADWQAELAQLRPTEKNPRRSLLEKHFTDYTARNTFDYFIHKDLGGFLRRELDFFIKNEIMHLDDIEHESAPRVEQYLSKIKVIRLIAHKIVDFLAQIENFQKKLWLKKKFVVETNYCVTLDRVPEDLYPEIAANDAQREEWVRLFAIDEIKGNLHSPGYSNPFTVEFLKINHYLNIDTKFFGDTFKNRLISSLDNLDEQLDGFLVQGENLQTMILFLSLLESEVKCIYLDPPYNTGQDGFPYKDNYKDSSWISLIIDRIFLSKKLLCDKGSIFVSIDDIEIHHLRMIMNDIYGSSNFIDNIIWKKRYGGGAKEKYLVSFHEYVLFFAKHKEALEKIFIPLDPESIERYYKLKDDKFEIRGPYRTHPLEATKSVDVRPNLVYPIPAPDGTEIRPERQWWWDKKRTMKALQDNDLEFFKSQAKWVVHTKQYLRDENGKERQTKAFSIIDNVYTQHGAAEINDLFGDSRAYTFPKPSLLISQLLKIAQIESNEIIFDFFAGSGPTAQAIINLNREDGKRRKYILVEIASYFDSVLIPRIKKVIYSKDWKGGKPVSREGSSHMFKYIRLESYEDTLNNLELKRTEAQKSLLDQSAPFKERYMLSYMLDVESRGSASLLNIDAFEDPFNYKLNIATGSAGETKPATVDLVETFNYLLGLTVRHLDHIRGFRVVQGTNPQGEKVLVIWRNLKEKTNADLEEFFRKQEYNPKDLEFDLIYVNGDNNLENLRRPDETWKVRLIEEEFHRLMFQVEDV